ncbi:MAG: CAF17-like 4Fe-4S cluster assembly/insertion protein YgfZ [Acidobacteriaceae bacterium]
MSTLPQSEMRLENAQPASATPLAATLQEQGKATLGEYHGVLTAPFYSDAAAELKSLLRQAGAYDLGMRGWVRVTGEDRVRWLNGMVTNSIQQLAPGAGCYNLVLNAQGRIQGDVYAFQLGSEILLQTDRTQLAHLIPMLDHFIIMDDVELNDLSAEWTGIGITGPEAAAVLSRAGISIEGLQPIQLRTAQWNGVDGMLVAAYSAGAPKFEIWCKPEQVSAIWDALLQAGATACGSQSMEWLRLLEGTPHYGTDIRDKDLAQETGQTRALHFAKGCYLGQEIVERIRSRGNVHRILSGFHLTGELPAQGSTLEADGQKAGELTSAARIPLESGEVTLALGYVRREVLERKAELHYTGGTAEAITLPYPQLF